MQGLAGEARAKAWSWERNCYEVRWERLATYVSDEMERRKHPTQPPPGTPAEGWPIQIPQDAGSRGVANRDRDPLLACFPSSRFPPLELTLELQADPAFDEAEVSVLDALGDPVVSAIKVPGTSVTFSLAPKTYAARVTTADQRVGRVRAPIELYDTLTEQIKLGPDGAGGPQVPDATASEDVAVAGLEAPSGTIAIHSRDPLGTAEILDEAGQVVAVTTGDDERALQPGFYRVRHFGPEESGNEQFVVLAAGEAQEVELQAPPAPSGIVAALVDAMGGSIEGGHVIPVPGAEPIAWPQPSTIVLAGVGAALHGEGGLERIGLTLPTELGEDGSGVALYAVASDQDTLKDVRTRIWAAGDPVPVEPNVPQRSEPGISAYVTTVAEASTHWVSFERDGVAPTVAVLPLLPGRLAVFVAQVEPDQVQAHQAHPVAGPGPSSTPDRLRRMETLQRLLVSGRLDGAPALARELAAGAHEDPFAGCLAGYVLLRLGLHDELGDLTDEIVGVAPKLSDAYILRGEHEAAAGRPETAAQAFADAVNAGIPAFGEGLTRLVEGLRATAFNHPRGSLVRHIFQSHTRGSMWSAFAPRRELEAGRLVITGADVGFEG